MTAYTARAGTGTTTIRHQWTVGGTVTEAHASLLHVVSALPSDVLRVESRVEPEIREWGGKVRSWTVTLEHEVRG